MYCEYLLKSVLGFAGASINLIEQTCNLQEIKICQRAVLYLYLYYTTNELATWFVIFKQAFVHNARISVTFPLQIVKVNTYGIAGAIGDISMSM